MRPSADQNQKLAPIHAASDGPVDRISFCAVPVGIKKLADSAASARHQMEPWDFTTESKKKKRRKQPDRLDGSTESCSLSLVSGAINESNRPIQLPPFSFLNSFFLWPPPPLSLSSDVIRHGPPTRIVFRHSHNRHPTTLHPKRYKNYRRCLLPLPHLLRWMYKKKGKR